MGLNIDPDTQGANLADGLKYLERNAKLMQRKPESQPANASARDQNSHYKCLPTNFPLC
jgi:hypothetical protein